MKCQIRMFTINKICHYILQQVSILLISILSRNSFTKLLNSPYSPQKHIRMFHFVHYQRSILSFHESIASFSRSIHYHIELIKFINGKSQSRQRDKHITCTTFKPWVTCQNIIFITLLVQELMSSVYQTVFKAITRSTSVCFLCKQFVQSFRFNFRDTTREHNRLILGDFHFKISRNIQVFVKIIPAFLLFCIFYTSVPVGLEMKIIIFTHLHVQIGISRIHASFQTIFNFIVMAE